jgi:hypothetical protein
MPQLPTFTPEQRADALAKALETRRLRKEALDELSAGSVSIDDALSGNDPRFDLIKIHRVLIALPGVGKVRAERALSEAEIPEGRRVRGLGSRQRKALANHFARV